MALINYNRATDATHLVRDRNVEVLDLFYAPYVEDEGDLSIGDGDPAKAGAIASVSVDGEVKLAVYQGDGTWKIVGELDTPTLQQVTDEGNVTSNGMFIGGNSPSINNGLNIGYNKLERFGGSGFASRLLFSNDTVQLQQGASTLTRTVLQIGLQDEDNAGVIAYSEGTGESRIYRRVSGADALNDDDFVTKRQLDAGAPTYTSDPSTPNTSALSYLNTTYPNAKPGDQVYKVASGMRRTWTCYAPGEWSRIDEVIET